MRQDRRDYWSKLIAEQEASGQSMQSFCKQRGVGTHSFYMWRKRLREEKPPRFALLKTVPGAPPLEVILADGERLRIGAGVDAATLRLVLDALRR